MRFCIKCGKQLESDERFCSACGAPIAKSNVVRENSDLKNQSTSEKLENDNDQVKSGKVRWMIVGLLVILLILFCGSSRNTCDWCGKAFFGSGYYDILDSDVTICEDCAKDYYDTWFPYENYKRK